MIVDADYEYITCAPVAHLGIGALDARLGLQISEGPQISEVIECVSEI